jgi:hypothetical protein
MPAIQLARLKIQVTDLLTHFGDPASFVTELHALLDFYADRTRRPGRSGKPKPLIQAYNVPRQVMRRIGSDLAPVVLAHPTEALDLADDLWRDSWFECRVLAIDILGTIPPKPSEIVLDRLRVWSKTCREDALLNALLDQGVSRLREESPDVFLGLIEVWLTDTDLPSRKVGLRALPALIQNPDFENLPKVYRLLTPFLREAASVLETDLLRITRALAKRSPQETAYFLQQMLTGPHKSGLNLIVRRSLEIFPPELQDSLRVILREQMRSSNGVS